MIEFVHAGKTYPNGVKGLKDISLTIEQGEFVAIIGLSGAGKSTLIRTINRMIDVTAGKVLVDGVDVMTLKGKALRRFRRHIGMIFQSFNLVSRATVIKNVLTSMVPDMDFFSVLLGIFTKKQEMAALAALDKVGILDKAYTRCDQLSGGQQQRVALARILAYRPEIILLDEPFAALDEYLKEQLHLQLVEVLRHWGNNVILVTHNRDEVYKICDKLLVMDDGGPIGMGDTTALFAAPERVQIARLTGCKNISRARKCGEYSIEALDWGLHFTTARPVGKEITAVGVRAHDFHPAKASDVNAVAVAVVDTNDSPFERNIIFRTAGDSPLWWKCPRETEDTPLPAFLAVAPESVLLLKE